MSGCVVVVGFLFKFARFVQTTYFLARFRYDSAWLDTGKLKNHVFNQRNIDLNRKSEFNKKSKQSGIGSLPIKAFCIEILS